MKRLFTLFTGLFLMLFAEAQAAEFETATNAVKNMGVGWNLGNTLDANDATKTWTTTVQHETCWGQPVTKPELFKMMKEAGFGAIRVPVTWYQEMDDNGKVNEAWMKRVKEVVDYVVAQDMYCIINVHHDTGADKDAFKSWIKADEANYNQNKAKYEYLWRQIAEAFKDYGDKVLFESYNEMLDKLNSWCFASFAASGQYDATVATSAYNAINGYARSFVNAVRGTGGNNVRRNLIVNTYAAANGSGNWNAHLKDPLSKLVIPQGERDHIAVQVHAYPTIAGKTISAIRTDTKDLMNGLNTYFVSKGIPVIIGEWSTSNVDAKETDYDARKSLMFQFVDDFVAQAKALGIATFYWMGLSDGASRTMPSFNQADLAERIAKAYHGSNFQGKYPTADDFQTVYKVSYNSQWGELFLYGDWNSSAALKTSEYKGIRVELDGDYSSQLQVKIYGDKSGDNYKEQYGPLTSGTSTSTVTFNASTLGSNIYRITLQTLVPQAITAKVIKATLIKKDGSEVSGKISVGWGCTLTSESSPISWIPSITFSNPNRDDAIYNLQGQRLSKPTKGIVIQNGKKRIVR